MMYGRGLNSIRWRFTLASAVLTCIGVLARDWGRGDTTVLTPAWLVSTAGVAAVIALITFLMSSKLTGMIESLRLSTEAIAEGDFVTPVSVDCACEVGGLAHSFRKMSVRMNDNILRINTLAYTDPITALPNRSVIDHLLEYSLAPERRDAFRAAIVFIDLDGFKRINDTLGHEGGDELLRQAARRILEQGLGRTALTIDTCMDPFGNPCRRLPEDIVFARFAGDEFVAVLPGVTDRAELERIGQAVLAALVEPFHIQHQEVVVGASIGIAVAPDDTTSANELLTFADLAMYSAKRSGKARFTFFDQSLRDTILARMHTEADLRLALQRDELLLHFQPKINTETMALVGVEALVRWQHPQRGLLLPGAFIDVAEQVGLMTRLGERVLMLAVAQCRTWLDAGIEMPVAVNVSPSQFVDPSFVPGVLGLLARSGVPARLMSIEITESIAMTDFERTSGRLAQLRQAGIRIAIDDFGIGFSNLSQLSRLAVDEVKIDRSLIKEIGQVQRSEVIIQAIVGMTHALGYKTIAEGIETPEQLAFLRSLGSDYVQGYLFGKPMSAAQLAQWQIERGRMADCASAVPAL